MLILFKTQVNRAVNTRLPRCHARVGGLCGFRSPAERVPIRGLKTRRCADVRERCRNVAKAASTEENRLRAVFGGGRSRKRRGSRLWICQGIKMQKR